MRSDLSRITHSFEQLSEVIQRGGFPQELNVGERLGEVDQGLDTIPTIIATETILRLIIVMII